MFSFPFIACRANDNCLLYKVNFQIVKKKKKKKKKKKPGASKVDRFKLTDLSHLSHLTSNAIFRRWHSVLKDFMMVVPAKCKTQIKKYISDITCTFITSVCKCCSWAIAIANNLVGTYNGFIKGVLKVSLFCKFTEKKTSLKLKLLRNTYTSFTVFILFLKLISFFPFSNKFRKDTYFIHSLA